MGVSPPKVSGPPLSGVSTGPITALRARIQALEGSAARWTEEQPAPLEKGGLMTLTPAIDTALPWGGLPAGGLHEIMPAGPGHPGAATAFAAALAARFANGPTARHAPAARIVLWCTESDVMDAGGLYAPGIGRFGLEVPRLALVRARRTGDVLWALEEAVHSAAPGAVVAEISTLSLTASRRLQLAAEKTGVPVILLRPFTARPAACAALTRWRIGPSPSLTGEAEIGSGGRTHITAPAPRIRAELFRCRGGAPGAWLMEWQDETGAFDLVTPLRDRTDHTPPTRLAG